MVDIAQLVRAPGCGPGGHGFESHYPPHLNYVGVSPSGKAQDFDSCIPVVRIHPPQPFLFLEKYHGLQHIVKNVNW